MPFNLDFKDKVVLVSGSNSGIGEATVLLFAELGAKVVVHGRNKEKVSEVANRCSKVSPKGYKALEVIANVRYEAEVDRLMDEVIQTYHQIDVIVNNAGMGGNESNASLEEFDAFMNTNLRSCYQICLRAQPFLERSKGVIINVSSVCSLKPFNHSVSYCVAKAGLDMLTRSLAQIWGPKGIRVNSVNPGQIQTNLWESAGKMTKQERDVMWKAVSEKTPVRRPGYSEDIAKSIVFLAANDSGFTTGVNLKIDGGFLDSPQLILD